MKDDDKVWKIVKALRQFYHMNTTLQSCRTEDDRAILSFYEIGKNIQEIEKELKLDENIDSIRNISRSDIQTAGNMFTYLNYCPPLIVRLYKILLKSATTREMIVAMSNIIKTSRKTEKKIAIKIWHKLMENFGSTYRKIEKITDKLPDEPDTFSLNEAWALNILGHLIKEILLTALKLQRIQK